MFSSKTINLKKKNHGINYNLSYTENYYHFKILLRGNFYKIWDFTITGRAPFLISVIPHSTLRFNFLRQVLKNFEIKQYKVYG